MTERDLIIFFRIHQAKFVDFFGEGSQYGGKELLEGIKTLGRWYNDFCDAQFGGTGASTKPTALPNVINGDTIGWLS